MKLRLTRLQAGESMRHAAFRKQLDNDCGDIVRCVEQNPGIPSKRAIANKTRLTVDRVCQCIRKINENETPFHRIDYGTAYAKSGPYAGEETTGWWPMRYALHQHVMDQADDHSTRVIVGVRWSQLDRLAYAQGLTTAVGRQAVRDLEARAGVSVELMSETDYEAFVDLLIEQYNGA